jgi:chitin disaccharide deacetylase
MFGAENAGNAPVDGQMGQRSLIVNGDDFGYTRGVNRAIAHCYRVGILSSTTLMANGAAFADAVARTKDLPGLGIGVHLVLTELKALTPPQDLPGLVDRCGFLPPTPGALFTAVLLGKISRRTIQRELQRQVTSIIEQGITPTHLDTHKHVHLLPPILEAMIAVAHEHGIRWIRNPFDACSLRQLLAAWPGQQPGAIGRQALGARLVRITRRTFARRLRQARLDCPDHFFGTALTGIWNEAALRRIMAELPVGVCELMAHPGECDPDLRRQRTRLLETREQEMLLLTSPAIKEHLLLQKISLQRYGDNVS